MNYQKKSLTQDLKPCGLNNKSGHINTAGQKGGGEGIPLGGWRGGGEDIPPGGWRGGGEDIPPGGWRGGGEDIPPGGWRGGGEEIPAGGWRGGGENIPPGGWRVITNQSAAHRRYAGGEAIPAGSFLAIEDVYRTRDGSGYFKFRFYQIGDYYEIDILAMPSYGNRDTGPHVTHRLTSGRGGYKICFGDPTIVTTLTAARQWAAMWSEHTMNYIRFGTPFPNS